jgi:branched-chain amino acid transport system ATP-binding protein/branched-chain amino acid transport system permease protein
LTLALSQLVYSVALKWRDVTGGSDGLAIADKPSFLGFDLSNSLTMYFMALVFFAAVYWALRRLLNAPLGHVFIGIRENEQRMSAIGYPTSAYELLSFTIAGAIAGLAGGLYAIFNGFISSDAVYWTASGDILIMTMLGGAGTLIGPAIGATIFLLMKDFPAHEERGELLQRALARGHRRHLHLLCHVLSRRVVARSARSALAGSQMTLLRLDRLNKSFGSLTVTEDLSLAIAAGERHVIIGPNGAGKTSLINQISGQLQPSSGRILLQDRDITGASPDRISRMGVARTFQRNNLFQNLSVIENIRLALLVRRSNPLDFFTPVDRDQALAACGRLDDAGSSWRRLEVLVRLKSEGLAILLVEQSLRTAFAVGDRHYVMNKGEICFSGNSTELERNDFVLRNYLSV